MTGMPVHGHIVLLIVIILRVIIGFIFISWVSWMSWVTTWVWVWVSPLRAGILRPGRWI